MMMDAGEENDAEDTKEQRIRCLYAGLHIMNSRFGQLYPLSRPKHPIENIIESPIEVLQHKKKKPNEKLVRMEFLRDSKMVVLGYDKQSERGDINFIDASEPKIKDFFYNKLEGGVGGIACFQNGYNIMIADRKGMFSYIDLFKALNLNDIKDKEIKTELEGVLDVSLCPAETKIVCGLSDKRCVVMDIKKERRNKKFLLHKTFNRHMYGVNSVDWHPFKSLVVSSSIQLNDSVKLWDPHSEELVHETATHKSIVSKVMFHPEGNTYFSLGKDNVIIEHELRRRGSVNRFHLQFEPNHMQVLRDNRVVVGDSGGYMSWFSASGQLIHSSKGNSGVSLFTVDQTNNLLVLGRQREHIFEIYSKLDPLQIR